MTSCLGRFRVPPHVTPPTHRCRSHRPIDGVFCKNDCLALPAAEIVRLLPLLVLCDRFFKLYFKHNQAEAAIYLNRALVLNRIDPRTRVYLPAPTQFPMYFAPDADQARRITFVPNNHVPRAWMIKCAQTAEPPYVEATLHHFRRVDDTQLLLVLMWNCRMRYLNFVKRDDLTGAFGKAYYLYWAGGHLKLEGLVLHRVVSYLGHV